MKGRSKYNEIGAEKLIAYVSGISYYCFLGGGGDVQILDTVYFYVLHPRCSYLIVFAVFIFVCPI